MDTIVVLLIGMLAGALLAAAYHGVNNLRREIAELRKDLEAGKKRLPQNAENNLLNALAVILDAEMNLSADQLRLEQARKILFAVREDPFGDADAPAGPRPKGMKIDK
jgi:Na+-translocating ferredoxin:NAD+ oxidoreductase RnfG subunit